MAQSDLFQIESEIEWEVPAEKVQRQVYGYDVRRGKIEPAISQRGPNSLAAFLNGIVRQADHVESSLEGGRDIHLNLNEVGVNPKHSGAESLEEHPEQKA